MAGTIIIIPNHAKLATDVVQCSKFRKGKFRMRFLQVDKVCCKKEVNVSCSSLLLKIINGITFYQT